MGQATVNLPPLAPVVNWLTELNAQGTMGRVERAMVGAERSTARPLPLARIGLRGPRLLEEEAAEEHAGGKSADVRPEGDAADLFRAGQSECAVEQLADKPQSQIEHGRNIEEKRPEEYRHQHGDLRFGIQQEIGAQHAGDGPGGAEGGHLAVGLSQQLRQPGQHAAEQIEHAIAQVAHDIFDVVAEDPKSPHVAQDVQPAGVKELMSEKHPPTARGKSGGVGPCGIGETRRDDAEQIEEVVERFVRQRKLIEEHQRVNENQGARDHGHRAAGD